MKYYSRERDPGTMPAQGQAVPVYEDIWDADQIRGCNCDDPYFGPDCSLRTCPFGDDPMTGNEDPPTDTNPLQSNEIQSIQCRAASGYFTLSFRGQTTKHIVFNAVMDDIEEALNELTSITSVKLSGNRACEDSANGVQFQIEFKDEFGNLPMVTANYNTLAGGVYDVSFVLSESIPGTKENLQCSRRGLCDTLSGICTCGTGYDTSDGYGEFGQRGDCGYNKDNVQFCPGVIACSGHGSCVDQVFTCECNAGWQGSDCSERICQSGTSWFAHADDDNSAHVNEFNECSDMGICDRSTGDCLCFEGFESSSCNIMKCPGDPEECSGKGQCKTMNELAKLATINGNLAGFTYGEKPNDPPTWDANRIKGCFCNHGYEGFDCSLRLCPVGDNPDTEGQMDEQQRLTCSHNSPGALIFVYKQERSGALPVGSTTYDVKATLEAMDGIGEVSVEVESDTSNGNVLCGAATNTFIITFLTEHGDLPDLELILDSVDASDLRILEHTKGTKESVSCSDRGICDTTLGSCACFSGYGSSDNKVGPGPVLNCGYKEPILGLEI
jgi:hypothetical protein